MIKKITLEIGDKEVEVTMEEAQKLFHDLEQLFPDTPVPYPVYPVYPLQTWTPSFPQSPWYCYDNTAANPDYGKTVITC